MGEVAGEGADLLSSLAIAFSRRWPPSPWWHPPYRAGQAVLEKEGGGGGGGVEGFRELPGDERL